MHTYAPWMKHHEAKAGKLGFPRGYYLAWGGGRTMPGMGAASSSLLGGLYGTKLKTEARRYFGSFVGLSARGEMIPNEQSVHGTPDPVKKDQWGIPVQRFHFQWSDYEVKQIAHAQQTFADMIVAAGGKVSHPPEKDGAKAMTAGGSVKHEIGVTRMSASARGRRDE